jgi:hypothetical protein
MEEKQKLRELANIPEEEFEPYDGEEVPAAKVEPLPTIIPQNPAQALYLKILRDVSGTHIPNRHDRRAARAIFRKTIQGK